MSDSALKHAHEAIYERLPARMTNPIHPVVSSFNFVSVPELFYAQAAHHPEAVAFFRGNETITFGQFANRAEQLASLLETMHVGVGTVVGVSLERSFDMVAALIAILQTGAAFLPLDPGYPQERLAYMQQDAGVQIVIATRATYENLQKTNTQPVLLDVIPPRKKARRTPPSPIRVSISPDAPAYLIYTSGSTGKPKGVVLPHQQIVNRFQWMWQAYPFEPGEMGCQRTALNFVDSLWEIFGYLLQGIPTAIIPDEIVKDPYAFVDELARCKVSRLWLVPSLLRVLLDSIPNLAKKLPDLKFWVTTGETIPGELFKRFQKEMPHATVYNLYGTSEVWDVTWYTPDEAHAHLTKIPIGKPITNYTAYILDDDLNPVPVGTPGMLYVGGLGLGYGYLNRPALTAERFIPNPFAANQPGDLPPSPHDLRLYKTGDLACWLPDGNLEFLGRADFQIKIRGHRVELGEVETAIREHPEVKNVVVVDKEAADGEKKLVAYLVMREDSEVSVIGLRKFLREKLPDHMVPAYYEFLAQLPLTPSGKIDRKMLPEPRRSTLDSPDEYIPPRSVMERQLVALWEDLLEIQPIGIRHNFFDYGGYSLLAIRMFARVEEITGKKLPLTSLFLHPTIEGLAKIIENDEADIWATVVDIQPKGDGPPFFCVHGFGGGVLGYLDLATALGEDQPFFGLRARGLEAHEKPHDEVEKMAAYYIEAMRKVQPHGPYYLGGYCEGGVIAFEMARQLEQEGETSPVVAIFEGFAPLVKEDRDPWWHPKSIWGFFRNLPLWLRDFLELDRKEMWARTVRKISTSWLGFALKMKLPVRVDLEGIIEDVSGIPPRLKHLMETHDRALMRYRPPPFGGKVALYRVRGQSLFGIHDEDNGWSKLAKGGVEVQMIGGTHSNILEQPHVNILAQALKATLEQAHKTRESRHES